jgi:hypothetical protein
MVKKEGRGAGKGKGDHPCRGEDTRPYVASSKRSPETHDVQRQKIAQGEKLRAMFRAAG